MLPTEIWKHIALQYTIDDHPSPIVYMQLALTSREFIIPTHILQEYYLRTHITKSRIECKLPNGNLHSPDYCRLPAVICTKGNQEWYVNGTRHRYHDAPAVMYANGHQEWYVHDKRHRDNDMPATIYANGCQEWYIHGKLIKQ